MRALFYEFPEDEKTWNIMDQYMYGPDILVAPVCYENAKERKVYLPAGSMWVSAETGKEYKGGESYEISAPLDVIPVFLREGRQEYLIKAI